MALIDLTLTLDDTMPGVDWETARTLESDGWNARTLHLYSHCGTHMDAPLHFGCGSGATIDDTPLERCLTLAHVVRLRDLEPAASIRVADIGSLAHQFEPGHSLLLHTGWSEYVDDSSLYRDRLPRVSEELATWCVQSGVAVLGVEPPSVADVNNLDEVTQVHQLLLGGGVTIVEGLTNLNLLPDHPFLFGAFPLKVKAGDGAPCRAFASTESLTLIQES